MVFGTDGFRGIVDKELTAEIAYNIGKAFAIDITKRKLIKKVIIGCDTRISNNVYVNAVSCGLMDYGVSVEFVGIVSTPIVSYLVSKIQVGGGIMITASHNDYTYNGIKLFNEFGQKMPRNREKLIETHFNKDNDKSFNKGMFEYNTNLIDIYIDNLKKSFDLDLSEYTIVLDCANGSNYKIAVDIFKYFGANVIPIACKCDGLNINNNCGANYINNLQQQVVEHNADFGFAFDGDGDRLRVVLSNGKVLSGDDLILLFAIYLHNNKLLNKDTIVGTVMTNNGLENILNTFNIKLLKTDVGDRNVISLLDKEHLNLGGEPSGHICLNQYNPTCDALFNSLYFLKCISCSEYNYWRVFNLEYKYYSITRNILVDKSLRENFDENMFIKRQLKLIEKKYKDIKLIVRPSGTEPVIRIYVESNSESLNENIVKIVEEVLKTNTK